jgi:CrcB protein
MNQLLLIALGGGIGSVFRYLLSTGVHNWLGKDFPYGTFVVNAIGGLLMGFAFTFLLERSSDWTHELRALLIVGFLGGLTTFSTFSWETLQLIEKGALLHAAVNTVMSIIVCIGLAALGTLIARQI